MIAVDDVVYLSLLNMYSWLANAGTIRNRCWLFPYGEQDWCQIFRRFYEELPAPGSQWAWPEQHELCGESSSCADLHVGVHLRPDQSFQREGESTQGATGIASATAGGCSRTVILFYQEWGVVVWHWAGIYVAILGPFLSHLSNASWNGLWDRNLFADCSSHCITMQKMFIWLYLSEQHILTTFH